MRFSQQIVKAIFKDEHGDPFILSEGQADMFEAVYDPTVRRVAMAGYTQYGKSDVTSMAIITCAGERYERILILAPSEKQSRIIMNYVIRHLFDDETLTAMINFEGDLRKLKQERSKTRITFKNNSEIMILTTDVRTVTREAKNIMGFGATMVIEDESSLIPDSMNTKILRMVGGQKDGKLVKLGNTFERNHFHKSLNSPRYKKVVIDYEQGLREGRITQEFIDEAIEDMGEMDFDILYRCKFPDAGAEDSLIPYDWIEMAIEQAGVEGDTKQAGLDVARFGRDKSVFLMRSGGKVTVIEEVAEQDTMTVVGWVNGLLEKHNPETLGVDVIGIGAGVYDRLNEMTPSDKCKLVEINVGESPDDGAKFFNLRAEVYWNLREQFRPEGGKSRISIPNNPYLIKELRELRYKFSSERKIKIEDKQEMKKRLGYSPDHADALAIAFANLTGMEAKMYIG